MLVGFTTIYVVSAIYNICNRTRMVDIWHEKEIEDTKEIIRIRK